MNAFSKRGGCESGVEELGEWFNFEIICTIFRS
jgi:hypothetical protein